MVQEEEDLGLRVVQQYRFKTEHVITKTSQDQEECEQSCAMFFYPLDALPLDQQLQLQQLGLVTSELQPRLMREKHISYLKRGLDHLPGSFAALDASRPWICYWIVHSLELLDAFPPENQVQRIIDTIQHFWSPYGGGFGGGPSQLGHTATTYASCLTLAMIGTPAALEAVNRQALYQFFLDRKDPTTGAFAAHDGGEVDVRVTYCVMCIASLFGILTPALVDGVVAYVVSCQTYEGGFAGEPYNEAHGGYAFCAIATLWLLESLDHIQDLQGFVHWLTNRQMPLEGGYQGRTNKLVDGCYSFWQGALPALLAQVLKERYDMSIYQCHRLQLQKYILLCGQQAEGGLRDKPGKPRDHYHSCYCLSGLSVAQHGDGTSEPVVYGDASNALRATHPAYNISREQVTRVKEYFDAQGPFCPLLEST